MPRNNRPYLSVVIPFYNEAENIERLWEILYASLLELQKPFEIIFVDDGSCDGTREIMRRLAAQYPQLRVILFRANFGQSAAMAAGFEASRGKVVVAMDGDLQNDPRDIRRVVAKIEEGYDVVSGWRKNRQDKFLSRKIPSMIANRIICRVTHVELHDTGCSLKAFRGDLLRRIALYGELHRFIPALLRMEGAKITELPVQHHARLYGKSKYNISRTFRVIMDLTTIHLLMKHLHNPLAFFTPFALAAGIGGLFSLGTAVAELFRPQLNIDVLNLSIILTILLWSASFMFSSLGLVAKLIVAGGERRSFSIDPHEEMRNMDSL
ncbi:MAG: glycosyltransferase family 2 protein [candidate division KSB1 bacterium]|nr:glycosyltransferase family 2 protein [candidate division KSB1 bacterium]MDZ7346624.1 glycosyltransferase family 2 protein [candidate division KSB1 bacterium]